MVADFAVAGDSVRAAPTEEFQFDIVSVGMAADIAATGVRAHRGTHSRRGWAAGRGLLKVPSLIGHVGPSSEVRYIQGTTKAFHSA